MRIKWIALVFFASAITACGPSIQNDAKAMLAEDSVYFVVTGEPTVLKKTKEDSANLTLGSEKCNIPADTKVTLSEQVSIDGNHYLVNTAELLPNCSFSKGYIFAKHISKTSLPQSEFSANVRAFLDTIGYAEGTGDNYDFEYTFAKFYSFADHPRELRCSYGLCSDAAGRYQFLSTTWDNLARRLGLQDFSPENQDRAAVLLLKDNGVYSTIVNISGIDAFSRAAYGVSTTWASFPGSPYGQPRFSVSQLYTKFQGFLNRY